MPFLPPLPRSKVRSCPWSRGWWWAEPGSHAGGLGLAAALTRLSPDGARKKTMNVCFLPLSWV